jgi:hypothetical protein
MDNQSYKLQAAESISWLHTISFQSRPSCMCSGVNSSFTGGQQHQRSSDAGPNDGEADLREVCECVCVCAIQNECRTRWGSFNPSSDCAAAPSPTVDADDDGTSASLPLAPGGAKDPTTEAADDFADDAHRPAAEEAAVLPDAVGFAAGRPIGDRDRGPVLGRRAGFDGGGMLPASRLALAGFPSQNKRAIPF